MGLYHDGFDAARMNAPAVAAEMRLAVEAWFDAHIQILDPAVQRTSRGEYDPRTDSWSTPEPSGVPEGVLWDSGPQGALVQPLRASSVGDFGAQAVGLVGVRIQAAVPAEVDLRSGLQIVVLDGGADTESTRHLYVLGSGIDSSLRWVTRMTAMVSSGG